MKSDEIIKLANQWDANLGSIDGSDAMFLAKLLLKYRPKNILEIGTASGYSSNFIATIMDKHGYKCNMTTIDKRVVFHADNSKKTGYLLEKTQYDNVTYKIVRGEDSLYPFKNESKEKFDFVFIDANHQHPWPAIDTINVIPYLAENSIIVHHDIQLHKFQKVLIGIGSKYLYDQIPEEFRIKTQELIEQNEIDKLSTRKFLNNIFAIKVNSLNKDQILTAIAESLYLPWNLVNPLSKDTIKSIRLLLKAHYSRQYLRMFNHLLLKMNINNN